jgi:hypothetical protein
MKGGRSIILTEQERITSALNGNYTPLINAIISGNTAEIRRLLQSGADANQRDNIYNWCPLKWFDFVHFYGNLYNDGDYEELLRLFMQNGARACYDDYHIQEDSYNFSPVILDIDEQLERIRREAEEDEEDQEVNVPNRINMAGGRHRKKSRKSRKSRKHKKTNKKGKRRSTKRRKYMKK